MKTVLLAGIILNGILYVICVLMVIVGKCHIGYAGYPDEWESKKCESIYNVVSVTEMILLVALMVLSIIFSITH